MSDSSGATSEACAWSAGDSAISGLGKSAALWASQSGSATRILPWRCPYGLHAGAGAIAWSRTGTKTSDNVVRAGRPDSLEHSGGRLETSMSLWLRERAEVGRARAGRALGHAALLPVPQLSVDGHVVVDLARYIRRERDDCGPLPNLYPARVEDDLAGNAGHAFNRDLELQRPVGS